MRRQRIGLLRRNVIQLYTYSAIAFFFVTYYAIHPGRRSVPVALFMSRTSIKNNATRVILGTTWSKAHKQDAAAHENVHTAKNAANEADKQLTTPTEKEAAMEVPAGEATANDMHYSNFSKLPTGVSVVADLHAEIETRHSHDFLAHLERELVLSKRGPWRNGSMSHSTVTRVEFNNGENVRDWFNTHGAYVQDWMLQDPSASQHYDRMYRDWGKEIFQKKRFSQNVLNIIRASGDRGYRNIGDGIENKDPHKLDAGLISESGISSWPAVVVFRDAMINADGDVQTQEFMMTNAGCGSSNAIESNFMGPNHDIVISIAQFWGYGYFHFVYENLVRLPLLLNITATFQQAMVQVVDLNSFTIEYIQSFGVPHHRIFKGNAAARILIIPQPVLCGRPSSMLLRVLRQVVLQTIISNSTVMSPRGCRILVVNRVGSRRVSNHGDMFTAIQDQHPRCELAVHSGKEPLKTQFELFRKATTIIAPHGAGLSNMFISRPRTGVLEFLVINDLNLCYMIAAAKLGFSYWALAFPDSSKHGAMTANIPEVLATVKEMVAYALA
jgi:Glycosyltransferase 61